MEKIKYSMILEGVEARLRFDYPDLDEETLVPVIEKAQITCLILAYGGRLPYGEECRQFCLSEIPPELRDQVEITLMQGPIILDFEEAKWLVLDLELPQGEHYPYKGDPFGPYRARHMSLLSLVRADRIDFDG